MKRRLDNFEGAFPLLLIGSVLLVYAGLLASQEIGSKSSHLPLWGLLGGVGAVIVGAGIYSTFLESPVSAPPTIKGDWVTIPRSEWEAVRRGNRMPPQRPPLEDERPIWWEGPSQPVAAEDLPPEHRAPGRPHGRTAVPRRGTRPEPFPEPKEPSPRARASLKELRDELSELESLVYGESALPGLGPSGKGRLSTEGIRRCMDCERPFTQGAGPVPCVGCGRGMCANCAASSRLEDGEVRCVDCRARAV
ncbi:MAG TPA: hypothetical protein VEH28_05955 [Thermoplasmata archaeon]|nr:hypothetical protein [Thermoplasmata archaeon]